MLKYKHINVDENFDNMTNQAFIDFLKELGLSEHESAVYIASLSLGPSSIQKIAESAEIKRTTAYTVVDALAKKGLMSVQIKGFKKLHAAEGPEKLEAIVESQRAKLKNYLPELNSLYNLKSGEGVIRYYLGLEGAKNAYEDLLDAVGATDFYYVVSNESQWRRLDEAYFMDFRNRRAMKRKEKVKMLLLPSPEAMDVIKKSGNYGTIVKLLPEATVLTTNLVVTPQRVLIHQMSPPINAIVIENKSVIQMHKEMFEVMWNALPLPN